MISFGASLANGIVLFTAPVAFLASSDCWIPSSFSNFKRSAFDNFGPSAAILFASSGSIAASAILSFSPVCLSLKTISYGAFLSFSTTFFTSPAAAFLESKECIIVSAFFKAA